MKAAPPDVEFFLIAEQGILEPQAVLLCQSIRQFTGAYSRSPISVISPRRKCRPCRETSQKLARLDVEYLQWNLESPCPTYGTSFRVLAAARMEKRSGAPILIQLDSDTIFLREPDFSLPGVDAAARPVDVKGMCTEGAGDPFDPYWRALCQMLSVNYESIPRVTTTVDKRVVLANYNGGLVAVRREAGLFRKTEEFFLRLVAADHRPWANSGNLVKSGTGLVDRVGSEFWGTSQAVFSLAVTALGGAVQILSNSYNVPLHSFASLPAMESTPIHVHYHWLCSEGECAGNPMLDGRLSLPPEVKSWLEGVLPLQIPKISALEKLMRHKFLLVS